MGPLRSAEAVAYLVVQTESLPIAASASTCVLYPVFSPMIEVVVAVGIVSETEHFFEVLSWTT
jgi:hypothetical protein